MIRHCLAAAAFVAGFVGPSAARACDLALVFAVDVSASITEHDYLIQMRGLARALMDIQVADALVKAQAKISVIQWTGHGSQHVSLPWTSVSTFETIESAARQVAEIPRIWRTEATALGEALAFSQATFGEVPECARRVIDVSGDGRSNEGRPPQMHMAGLAAAGITVNALVIDTEDRTLTRYFESTVITGNGSFALTANGWNDYPMRIRQKLYREISIEMAALDRAEDFQITR